MEQVRAENAPQAEAQRGDAGDPGFLDQRGHGFPERVAQGGIVHPGPAEIADKKGMARRITQNGAQKLVGRHLVAFAADGGKRNDQIAARPFGIADADRVFVDQIMQDSGACSGLRDLCSYIHWARE